MCPLRAFHTARSRSIHLPMSICFVRAWSRRRLRDGGLVVVAVNSSPPRSDRSALTVLFAPAAHDVKLRYDWRVSSLELLRAQDVDARIACMIVCTYTRGPTHCPSSAHVCLLRKYSLCDVLSQYSVIPVCSYLFAIWSEDGRT